VNPILPVEVSDVALAADLADGMALVEEQLLQAADARDAELTEAARHLIAAGGKRLRPFLVLLGAQFGNPKDERIVPAAAAMELTHIATLYHDDVMDRAAVRRGVPSANALWGESVAVLTGDFLLARASILVADCGDAAIRLQVKAFARLVEGQLAETAGPQSEGDPFSHHFNVLANKTASLFASSGALGGLLSGAPPEVTACIQRACESWGMAYQLSDDVLDLTSDFARSGKPPGADLRSGVPTFPMLHALRSPLPSDTRLVELLRSGRLADPALHAEALALLRAHPSIDLARAEVEKWAEAARSEIVTLPDIPARAAFESLCDFVVESTR
jgi:heptaprenyl diphosphate synthase